MKMYAGSGCIYPHFLDLGTSCEVSDQHHASAALSTGEEPLVPIG
jgi:hypothetical protein